jgi:hypothetical protein
MMHYLQRAFPQVIIQFPQPPHKVGLLSPFCGQESKDQRYCTMEQLAIGQVLTTTQASPGARGPLILCCHFSIDTLLNHSFQCQT